ncbi:hypothetical protein [Thiorhodovibrio litoralis]|uniref:hypothetical protein n=1 Tax=Thiorhodovibrio litoralis TaxID=2952932 RepID=UPI002B263118|nr:hypothetical protein [Thiorhodovibrio litoralis]
MKKIIAFSFLALFSTNVLSAYQIEGDYSGSGEGELSLRTIVLENEKGVVAVSAFTGIPNACSGTVSGVGNFNENRSDFTNYTGVNDSELCTVTIHFNDSGDIGEMSESNCSYFHGPGCAFFGQLKKVSP